MLKARSAASTARSSVPGWDNDVINIAPTSDPLVLPTQPTLDGITGEVTVDSGDNEAGIRSVTANATAGFNTTLAAAITAADTMLDIDPAQVFLLPTPFSEFQIHVEGEDMLGHRRCRHNADGHSRRRQYGRR